MVDGAMPIAPGEGFAPSTVNSFSAWVRFRHVGEVNVHFCSTQQQSALEWFSSIRLATRLR
jgi:hypothetical protein